MGCAIVAAGALGAMEPESGRLFSLDLNSGAVLYDLSLGQARHFSTPAATEGFLVAPAGADVVAYSTARRRTNLAPPALPPPVPSPPPPTHLTPSPIATDKAHNQRC